MWVSIFFKKEPIFSFPLCLPPRAPVRYAPPSPAVTDQVQLQSNSLCKNMARASWGANNLHSLSWGGGRRAQTEKMHKVI